MSLANRCLHEFDSGIRNRGEALFRPGRNPDYLGRKPIPRARSG